jgi:acetyl-CoA C-acetyltransferase
VRHTRSGPRGIIVGRLASDDSRVLANPAEGDARLMELLLSGEPLGSPILLRPTEAGNKATLQRTESQAVDP